ncbi:MAG: hypothetical protein R2941_24740 [Desulfobacterales bacterium]
MKNETFSAASGTDSSEFSGNFHGQGNILSGLMREISISRIVWTVIQVFYLFIGAGAAFVSFLMEKEVFVRITQQPEFSFWMVSILESAKVMTIIVYGFLFRTRDAEIGAGTRFIVKFFQISLIGLSITCSLALVSFSLDRPNLEKVRADDAEQIEALYRERYTLLQKNRHAETAGLRAAAQEASKQEIQGLREYYEPRIRELRAEMRREMDNRVGSQFIGPRYKEFERLLEKTEAEFARKQAALSLKSGGVAYENALARKEEQYRQAELQLLHWRTGELEKIHADTYSHNDRAGNPLVSAVLRTFNEGMHVNIRQISVVCFFSLLMAILLETAIYVSFYSGVLNFSSKLDLVFVMDGTRAEGKKNF